MSCVDREFASFVSEMLMYAEFSVSSIQTHKDFTIFLNREQKLLQKNA